MFKKFVEVFLSMRARLSAGSRSDITVDLVPVLTIKSKSFYEKLVLFIGPATIGGGSRE